MNLKFRTNPAASKAALSNDDGRVNATQEEETMRANKMCLLVGAMVALAMTACGDTNGPVDNDGDCTTASCRDDDGDRVTVGGGDCNDGNARVFPGAAETCNGIDDNCDGNVDEGCPGSDAGTPDGTDQDGDGYDRCGTTTATLCDCDDSDPTVHPGASDVCDNGVDEDCAGGDADCGGSGPDCDDHISCTTDVRDGDACLHFERNEACPSGQRCVLGRGCEVAPSCTTNAQCNDGVACTVDRCVGGECDNDADAALCPSGWSCHPAAGCLAPPSSDVCDHDSDCPDEDRIECTVPTCRADGTCHEVANNDFCDAGETCRIGTGCTEPPSGGCRTSADCGDGIDCTQDVCLAGGACSNTFEDRLCPSGYECRPADPDADDRGCLPQGECAPGETRPCYDGTGATQNVGSCRGGTQTCENSFFIGFWWGECVGQVTPRAEACGNGQDDDCDGPVDEGCGTGSCPGGAVMALLYRDADGDTYGAIGSGEVRCPTTGWISRDTDCNDANVAVHPGVTDGCGNGNEDCDGSTDEDCATCTTLWYRDADGDGFGAISGSTATGCTAPTGYVADHMDCNDSNTSVRPTATESCNGVDDDCDGLTDEGCGSTTCPTPSQSCHTSCDLTGVNSGTQFCSSGSWGPCQVPNEQCSNGRDDDCDGAIDSSDSQCGGTSCTANEVGMCGDGRDNDCDGRVDSADSDCGGSGTGCTATVRIRYHATYSGTLAWWLERVPGTSMASGNFSGTFDQTFYNVCPSSRWNGDNGTTAGNRFFCNYWAGAASTPWGDSSIEYWVNGESTSRRAYCQYDSAIPGGGGNFLMTF